MQVILSKPELERFVKDQVDQGRFTSADELVELAVTRLMAQDASEAPSVASLEDLRAKVAVGLAQARRGELSDGEEFFAELERDESGARVD